MERRYLPERGPGKTKKKTNFEVNQTDEHYLIV
jgi:hypothetical protein